MTSPAELKDKAPKGKVEKTARATAKTKAVSDKKATGKPKKADATPAAPAKSRGKAGAAKASEVGSSLKASRSPAEKKTSEARKPKALSEKSAVKAGGVKAAKVKDSSAKTTSAKTTSAKTTSAKTTSAKATSAKTTSAKATSAKATSAKAVSGKTVSGKTSSAKTVSAKAASGKVAGVKASSAKTAKAESAPAGRGAAAKSKAAPAIKAAPPVGRELAELVAAAAAEHKPIDPVLLDLSSLSSIADWFFIASADNPRQMTAIAEKIIRRARERGVRPLGHEGLGKGNDRWVLVDLGDVVIHIFNQETRGLYDLEGLWTDAPRA